MKLDDNLLQLIRSLLGLTMLLTLVAALALGYLLVDPSLSVFNLESDSTAAQTSDVPPEFENGIHVATGLVEGEGMQSVISNCITCHSAKLITQNRMNRDRWLSTIRWMQETQNLRDLGDQEEVILQYLSTYYAPEEVGRRKTLSNIEWYELTE